MTYLVWMLDVTLALSLVWVASRALASEDLFKAIALFVAFGMLMTFAWVRVGALDVALAEAAIGTGFTGALLFAGLARLQRLVRRHGRRERDGARS